MIDKLNVQVKILLQFNKEKQRSYHEKKKKEKR